MPAEQFDNDPLVHGEEEQRDARFVSESTPAGGFVRRWVKRLFVAGLLLLLVLGVSFWFARDWLAAKATELVDAELAKRGLFVRYESAEFFLSRGLVLDGLVVCETQKKEVPVIEVGNVSFKVGLGRLLRERSVGAFEATIGTSDAEVALYHEGERVLQLDQLDLKAAAGAERLQLRSLTAGLGDLDLELEGELVFASDGGESEAGGGGGPRQIEFDFSGLAEMSEWLDVTANGSKRPRVIAEAKLVGGEVPELSVEGIFDGREFSYRGVAFDRVTAAFDYDLATKAAQVTDAAITYRGGPIEVQGLSYAMATQEARYKLIDSAADLVALAGELSPAARDALSVVAMPRPVSFRSKSGRIVLADLERSEASVELAPNGLVEVDVGEEKSLSIGVEGGTLSLQNGTLTVSGLQLATLEGQVSIDGTSRPFSPGAPTMEGDVVARGLRLGHIIGQDSAAASGAFEATFKGTVSSDPSAISGSLNTKLVDGRLYTVPFIKQIHGLLAGVAPIFGRERREGLTADFEITGGVAHTEKMLIAGDGTLLHLRGDFDLGQESLDIIAYVTLDGAVGLATGVVTRLVEIKGSGPMSSPKLSLNKNPTDLAFNAFGGAVDLGKFGVKTVAGAGLLGAKAGVAVGKKGVETAVDAGKKGVETAVGAGKKGAETAVEGVRPIGGAGKGVIRKIVPGEKD